LIKHTGHKNKKNDHPRGSVKYMENAEENMDIDIGA